MTSAELEKITTDIFKENANRSEYGLKSDRNVQNRFVKSYKTRFFLELIQNARDAIVIRNINEGKIKAWVDNEVFYFANNGEHFTAEGVRSICYPAISTKEDKEMIGHKGIGFNAILEITEHPEIITEAGSFVFSTEETGKKLNKASDLLPLFQFPIFREAGLQELFPELQEQGYTTVIKLPLDKKVSKDDVIKQSLTISGQDIIFLSAITDLQIESHHKRIETTKPLIELRDDGLSTYFKSYEHSFDFSDETISTFDEDEQDQFKNDRTAECKFLLQTDVHHVFTPSPRAQLYLFYAMDLLTGFSFGIHSFFSVTIDRKRLSEKSPLNEELFGRIALYITGKFLEDIKSDFPGQVLEILNYERKANSHMEPLYNSLKAALPSKEFIYHETAGRYLRPSELLLVSKEENDLFSDGLLGDKYLLNVKSIQIRNWLTSECGVKKLDNVFILQHIETKCVQFSNDPEFFYKLYKQNQNWSLDISGKKILLTQHKNLVSGSEVDVYYQRKNEFQTPAALESKLAFLHPEIKVLDIREQSAKLLGLKEYSEDQLLAAALNLFKEIISLDGLASCNLALEIIRFIKRLNIIKPESQASICRDLRFPTLHKKNGKKKWLNLLANAVYFEDFSFATVYEDDFDYIDLGLLTSDGFDGDWEHFLLNCGVWKIPGAYIVAERVNSVPDPAKYIENDRQFHVPKGNINWEFAAKVISCWSEYHEFIVGTLVPFMPMRIQGGHVTRESEKITYSGLVNYLKYSGWIPVQSKDRVRLYQPVDLVAMAATDFSKTQNQIIREYLNIIQLDNTFDAYFIKDFGVIHLSNSTIDNYRRLLNYIAKKYDVLGQIQDKSSFEKFFNRVLSYLHDCLNLLGGKEYDINIFKEVLFLCRSLKDQSIQWAKGKDIIHIDQKTFLDKLTETGMLDNIRHPFSFTKKDRNEWGKYGQQIGRPISKIVKTRITSTGHLTGLRPDIKFPEVIIAFVEDDQDKNFPQDTLEQLRGKNLCIHQTLSIEMDIEGKKFVLQQQYYVEGEKEKTILHINQSLLYYGNKILSGALAEYFEHFTDSEMKRLDLIIGDIQLLGSKEEKYDYATQREIDLSRLEEIGQILDLRSKIDKEPEKTSTVIDRISSGNRTTEIAVQTITEEKQVKDIILVAGLDDYLSVLDNLLDRPVNLFNGSPIESSAKVYTDRRPGPAFPGIPRTELSDKSKKSVGFLGEYYVYKMISEKRAELLALLEMTANDTSGLDWYNQPRVTDQSLPDASIHKGCDMEHTALGIFIEVKAMSAVSELVTLTYNELSKMREKGDHYYLVIVKNVFDESLIKTDVIKHPYKEIVNGNLNFLEAKLTAPK